MKLFKKYLGDMSFEERGIYLTWVWFKYQIKTLLSYTFIEK